MEESVLKDIDTNNLLQKMKTGGNRILEKISENEPNLSLITKTEMKRLGYLTGLLQYIGKAAQQYQENIRLPEDQRRNLEAYYNPSIVSAYIAYGLLKDEFGIWAYLVFKVICMKTMNVSVYDIEKPDISIHDKEIIAGIHSISNNISIQRLLNTCNVSTIFLVKPDIQRFEKQFAETKKEIVRALNNRREWLEFCFITLYLSSILKDKGPDIKMKLNGKDRFGLPVVPEYKRKIKKIKPIDRKKLVRYEKNNKRFIEKIKRNRKLYSGNFIYSVTVPKGVSKASVAVKIAQKLIGDHYEQKTIYCSSQSLPDSEMINGVIKYRGSKMKETPQYQNIDVNGYGQSSDNKKSDEIIKDPDLCQNDDQEKYKYFMHVTNLSILIKTVLKDDNQTTDFFYRLLDAMVCIELPVNSLPEDYPELMDLLYVMSERFKIYVLLLTTI